jgi:hypothetical protein
MHVYIKIIYTIQNKGMSSCVESVQIYKGSKACLFYITFNSLEFSANS